MTTETKHKDIWEFLEFHNDTKYQDLAELVNWSTNFGHDSSPYLAFLDLIGYSLDEYGVQFYNWSEPRLGYLELNYLADALKLYTSDPSGVLDWITQLNEVDSQ